MVALKIKFPKRPNVIDERKFRAAFEEASISATGLAVRIVESNIKNRYPSVTSRTKDSIIGDVVSFHNGKRVLGIVGTPEKVAVFLEYGTRPHWAPLPPLTYWARRKIGNPILVPYIQRMIAVFISGKKGGTPAFKYFEKTFEATRSRAISIYYRAFQKLIRDMSK